MNYQDSIDFIFGQLPSYQLTGSGAYKENLNNINALLNALDRPEKKTKFVHIAGTNGKGSSAHAIAAVLQASNYKVGLYTSPHLKSFRERIKINGNEIEKNFIIDFVEKYKNIVKNISPSFFEMTVAMAYHYFAENQVDIAVIETGIGGRLDSTNVIDPEVALITNIGLDHIEILGNSLEKIAIEKSGIMKRSRPVIIGCFQKKLTNLFERISVKKGAILIQLSDEYKILLKGEDRYDISKNEELLLEQITFEFTL